MITEPGGGKSQDLTPEPSILFPGTPNRSVETYSDTAGYTLDSPHAVTPPEVWNPDYTHAWVEND